MPDAPTTGWLPMFTETTDLPDQRRAPVTGPAFRMPAETDPEPSTRRLLTLSCWAGTLALLGLAVAVRGLAALLTDTAGGWHEPATVACGVTGIAFPVAAFLSVHRRRLPWIMLATATTALLASTLL
ncbi:hypothetical protein J2S43_008201 [Catenuloplanes nepalensis]|uniref:Uncharacterized protein n=1 Tax=Catenuloplanes nepalensis TaxID=587533 RepID=A0ABT9N7L1_9ACTN|nr:hypothetical protein [Catenuloplanes nepalensis]MDP9799689.1 hypothetical protein [Catenuloplanes nepalensis]